MAMNLRLDPAHEELLSALATQERRTKTEIIKIALEEHAARVDKSTRTRAVFARILQEDAALLEALSE